MTVTFLIVIIIVVLAFIWYKPIHKYRYPVYGINLILALALSNETANYITFGFVALAFFLVVMFTGVLDPSQLRKRLRVVRAEYAVLGTIYLIPHFLAFTNLVLEELGFFHATLNYYLGLLSGIIILPLSITSFVYIRKKLSYHQWKNLHKLSYVAYGCIALHLIVQGTTRQPIYIGLFVLYTTMRLLTYWQQKQVQQPSSTMAQ